MTTPKKSAPRKKLSQMTVAELERHAQSLMAELREIQVMLSGLSQLGLSITSMTHAPGQVPNYSPAASSGMHYNSQTMRAPVASTPPVTENLQFTTALPMDPAFDPMSIPDEPGFAPLAGAPQALPPQPPMEDAAQLAASISQQIKALEE